MQDALRSLQTNNVTRKDIAGFAGVTPALVTYYFPERNTLIEAATMPVVETLAIAVRGRLAQEVDPGQALLHLIVDILTCYRRDIAIIELYALHRKALSETVKQNSLHDIAETITSYFNRWLVRYPGCCYDGHFLTNALLGICRAVAHNDRAVEAAEAVGEQGDDAQAILARAEMIHRMLVGSLSGQVIHSLAQVEVGSPPRPMALLGAAVRDKGASNAVSVGHAV